MAKRRQYDYNAIPDAEYFLRMRYNAPDNANVFGVGGGTGTFVETTQEENPMLYQQQLDTQNQNKFLNSMNENSNAMAGVMGGINNAITVLQDPNASNAQKVFGALGIGAASKIWEGDTSKVDNAIKDAQAQMQIGKNNLIQDASSISGAMQGLKANSLMPRQRINFTPTYYNNWKELKGGKGGFWKNMGTATLQGAANGSIGGPWGAAGGAVAGILGSVAGLFGRKDRYKKAMAKANERMNYMVNAARGFNMEQDFAEKAANQNLITNGINTQRVLDMANFSAYGGGIDISPNMMAMQQQKQDNDRLKTLNQPFSLGLGNSFNQKMNMFPIGGTVNEGNEEETQEPVYEGGELPEIEITGYKNSIYEPVNSWNYPETADPETIEWLANWLDKRRRQLYDNLQNLYYFDDFYTAGRKIVPQRQKEYDFLSFVPKNSESGYPTEYVDNVGITGYYHPESKELRVNPYHGQFATWLNDTFGNGEYRKEDIDRLFDTQIFNAASATEGGQNSLLEGTTVLGEYLPATGLNSWDKNARTHTVAYNPDFYKPIWDEKMPYSRIKKSVKIHERTHASNAEPQYETIGKILKEAKGRDGKPLQRDSYLDQNTEIYSRLMEERYRHNLSPLQRISREDLQRMREEAENDSILENHNILNRYDDDTLLKLFNEVAYNTASENYANVAAYGGKIDPTDYALAVTKEALNAERAKAKQNTQTVINMLYGDKHGEADNGNRYDFGGTMKNLPSEMQSYETGGTHEQNPYGGIQIGTDQQGNPNLVEQGEFRYGDYIFSDRIPVDYDTLFDFGLIASVPKKKPKKGQEKTYADYAKDLVNKTGDPNDPITKRTNDANLQRLANAEEYQKAAEQGQLALDDSLNEYKSALKNGASPMYGSMKYNGMNGGADPMDASSLTNVSRSGTPMMAAYGGNLFAAGGRPSNPLIINDPLAINRYKITPTIDNPVPIVNRGLLNDYTDNTQAFNIIDNNPEWTENDPWQAYNELNKYYDPYEIAALRESYGMQPQGGVDEAFVKALQTDLKNKGYYKGNIDGDFGPKSRAALDAMNGTWAWTPYNANAQVPTNTQFNGVLSKYNSSYTSKGRFAGSDAAQTAVEGMTNVHTTDPNSPQAPVENTGTIPPQTGQMADTTRWQFKKLPTQGKWATLGLNAVQAGADANGFTNPDFTPNFNDANRLERKGEASTFARTNAHIGGYQAPDITDIQSPLAQAIQQQQATNRALQNIGGGRNAAASIIANDYNAGQTMGDIVTKANAQNAANRMAAAEINRGIDQFNAQSDNDMFKDNLNAQINGQQMNLNATQAANENRLRQMLYQDATNRQAHQNIVTNQNQMYNNVLNMIADQAARNEEWNLINSKHNQDFYFDPKTGGWEYKGDSGAYSKLNNALATIYPDMPMTGLSADVQKEWNNLLQSKGGQNITDDEIRWIVDMERNAQIEQKAKREHELKLAELNKANTNTAKANGGYISNKMRNKYTNFDYNAI